MPKRGLWLCWPELGAPGGFQAWEKVPSQTPHLTSRAGVGGAAFVVLQMNYREAPNRTHLNLFFFAQGGGKQAVRSALDPPFSCFMCALFQRA